MAGLVVVASDIPWAEEIVGQFACRGYAAEIRENGAAFASGGPRAVLISLDSRDESAYDRVADLRGAGFDGVLMALGRIAPDLAARQKLAAGGAWYLPAFTGPEDIVSRVRMLLP